MKTVQLSILGMLISLFCVSVMAQTNYYVKPASSGLGNGSSWADATTLSGALATSVSGDIIHVTAGTYVPTVKLSNGADDLDMTFEIKNNIKIIGGYPANPTGNDVPTALNQSVLNGEIVTGYNAYHVVTITAPVETGKKVELKNIAITGGKSAASGTAITINTLTYNRTYGAALIIGAATVELNNCRLYENTGNHAQGMLAFGAANVVLNNCSIDNNTGTGNGTGIWNDNSTVTINNCNISNNQTTGACAGVYAVNSTKVSTTYMNNTTISNNSAGSRTAYYGRENSIGVMVNCTVYGNSATLAGAGVCLYTATAGSSTKAMRLDIINSTITNNSSVTATETSGGIRVNDAYCTLNIYNSIVSGNTVGAAGSKVAGDIALLNSAVYTKKNTIISDKAYDGTGTEISNKTFDFTTMVEPLASNGGPTKTCGLLLGDDVNPARSLGMSASDLTALGSTFVPVIPASIMAYDQLGNNRTGNVMGAWTANNTTSVSSVSGTQKPIVYTNSSNIYVKSEINDKINVHSITGQCLKQINATSNLTQISNLPKGGIYIVIVNEHATKVIF